MITETDKFLRSRKWCWSRISAVATGTARVLPFVLVGRSRVVCPQTNRAGRADNRYRAGDVRLRRIVRVGRPNVQSCAGRS